MPLFISRWTLLLGQVKAISRRMGQGCSAIGLAVLALAAGPLAAASSEPWLGPQGAAQVLIDVSGAQTPDEIRQRFERGDGRPAQADRIMPTGGDVAVWYHLALPPVSGPTLRVLAVPHPGMNRVDFYRPLEGGHWRVEQSGDAMAVAQWPLRYLHPAFEFVQQPQEVGPSYLRVQHSHPTNVRWTVWNMRDFQESSKRWHLLLGVYMGLVALVMVFCCVNAYSWRDPIHFYFAVYVAVVALVQFSITGLAGEYFWPDNAWWNDAAAKVLPMVGAALSHLFLRELVVERGARWVTHLMLAMAVVGGVLAASLLLLGRDPVFVLSGPYYLASLGIYLGVSLWYAWRLPRVGVWLLAGIVVLLVGSIYPILRNMQLVPQSFMTQYGVQIGAAIEIPLLLMALYLRNRERRDNQVRVGALSRVDPLTGTANHRVMLTRLEQLLRHQQRDPEAGVVIRVRIGNIQEIRADHGLQVAQMALVHAGACITHVVREGDTVARHRDGDFVVILEGRVAHDQVADLGQRLIARGLAPSELLPPGTVLQLKVAVAATPFQAQGVGLLLQVLETAVSELAAKRGKALRFVS
ncbi:7TM diverse intracellular signaling domain-containing protein [Polaromonas sp. SM01]|uniref:sensor domain-containing diguanylate cyclase n=1 Tax=Polaromonas sp. SM01 TaxID=3085630 RepID=UPI0029824CC3|nr:7TM diverse intracellular signaling domain-containing protein [Polaromonas sp. SM01]MDW5442330.1 7TM diverse intracellular signaling domain-containing protein [Polaromonas sp. SM01]